MLLEEMTTTEVEGELPTCVSVIIPFGVMEAHGAHLPLATDTLQAYDAAKRAAEQTRVFVAAPVAYGMCRSAAGHPGTIGISGDTLRGLTHDILISLYTTGLRNFILYSGHASTMQTAAMEEASEQVMQKCPQANIAIVLEYNVIRERGADVYEVAADLHAGEIETSRIMTIRPDLVREELLPEETYRESTRPILVRDTRRHWESSTDGAPRRASAKKGEQLGQVVGQYLAELVKKMNEFRPH